MSSKLCILAFAAGALAVPYQGHGHGHFHPPHSGSWSASGSAPASGAPFPYPSANATGAWGTTGTGTALSTSSVAVLPTTALSETDTYGSQAASSYDTAAASETDCTTDVTITTTEQTTVYVTAGASSSSVSYTSTVTIQSTSYVYASSAASSSSSSAAAYTPSTSSSTSSVAAYTPSSTSSSAEVSPVTVSSSSSSAAASSYVAPVAYSSVANKDYGWSSSSAASTSYAASSTAAPSSYAASSSSSSAAASSSAASSSGLRGKRGLAYNDASLTGSFLSSDKIGWGYNWMPDNNGLSSEIPFLPTFHDASVASSFVASANTAISNGAKTIFSLNEPDQTGQANLLPSPAAQLHYDTMKSLQGTGVDICAPSVSNGNGYNPIMGLDYLLAFMSECDTLGCQIDCINIHWYNTNEYVDSFMTQVNNATTLFPGKKVWITEFGITGGSTDEVNSFLEDVMPQLDSNSIIEGYSYFWVDNGYLVDGTSPSAYGETFMNA